MKLATAFTLAFAALATASTPQKPHAMVSIELEDVERELNGNELVARKQVTVCEADNFTSRPVSIGLRNKSDFVQSLASIIYRRVQRHDCTQTRGTIDDISYQYHTVGRHCDTTAQQIMIEGALKKAMNLPGRTAIWPTMCLRLKHGGTWEGFRAVGEASMFNQGVLCDGSLNFGMYSRAHEKLSPENVD